MIVGSRRKQRGALRTHDSAQEKPLPPVLAQRSLPNPQKAIKSRICFSTLVALGVSIQVLSTLNEVVESRMVYVHQAMLCQRPSRLSTPSTAVGVAL